MTQHLGAIGIAFLGQDTSSEEVALYVPIAAP
jgi:hypothetical protein